MSELRTCLKCLLPMTERNQPRIEGIRVFQARGMCSNCYQRSLESGEIVARKRNNFSDSEIQCAKCKVWKPVSKFKKANTLSGYRYVCRFCDKTAERYGITDQDYRAFYDKQNGKCAICSLEIELYGIDTHIDHDHTCCKSKAKGCGNCVRGLLCRACNLGLGKFKDSVENLQSAINYLKRQE